MEMLVNLIDEWMFKAEEGLKYWKDYEEVFEDVKEVLIWEFDEEMVDMLVSRIIKDAETRIRF